MCAAPAYLRRAGTPKIPDDLQAHRWLNYSEAPTRDEWRLTRDGKSKRVNIAHGLRSNHNHLLCDAAVDGAGICIQPTFNVWQHIAAGRLKTVLDDWSVGELGIYVVFPNRKFLPAKTRLFIDSLAAHFPRGPQHDVWRDRAQSRSTQRG
ncbi:MAG: substrate binding domain-containing protein [Dongiaceae bacterium]